ncbi:MAG: PBS lyase [Deltaproteobacteria bacterium]|nr:PBS lyase [Deltaproteobacteria bacterium]
MVGRFFGRDIINKPSCPFCGTLIQKPRERITRMPNEMPVGACSCGAVYACDVTGHNLGTAMIEALVFGCNGDWDLAWGLLPEDDYLEKLVEHYDLETHLIVHSGVYGGRRIAGTLYFIRLHQDIREVTEEGTKRQLDRALEVSSGQRAKRGKKSFTKKEVEELVKDYQIAPLLSMAREDERIIRDIQRLLYAVDKQLRWRAADAMGKVSAVIAEKYPDFISKLLQRLFTAIMDTAASSWGSLDAIGEIIRNSPEQFAGYLPHLYQFMRDRSLLAGTLRSLGRISEKSPHLIRNKAFHFIPLLHDHDPDIRGYSAILLGNLVAHEAKEDLTNLVNDTGDVEIYGEGNVKKSTLGQLATEALGKFTIAQ